MKKVTFKELYEMVALLLEKVDRIEAVTCNCNSEDFTDSNLFNTSETARFMGISSARLQKLALNGTLSCYQSMGSKSYFKKNEVSEWMSKNMLEPIGVAEQKRRDYLCKKYNLSK